MAGEYVLMPQGELLLDGKTPMVVNESMADIINKMEQGFSEQNILAYLTAEYGLSSQKSYDELKNILNYLKLNDIIC